MDGSRVEANREVLRERIRLSGYVLRRDWCERQPLVPVEEFFAEGVTERAIGNSRIARFGVHAFAALLREIERRDDVSDVAIEIDDDFDDGWPHCDYIFVATAGGADDVARLFAAIPPDTILRAGELGPWVKARTIRIEDLTIAPGYRLWALRWIEDWPDDP